jgi:hypothetical protein
METFVEPFLYFLLGSLVSWLITMVYYRKSSVKAPEWARPLIQSLPAQPINKDDFAKLFDEKMKDVVIDGGTF